MILEDIYNKAFGIENNYKNKKILFIGSESYDGGTITIIEGLSQLGFDIYVYKKTNINSWFCNKIIDNLDNIEENIDFVLSNLHWGTRWSLYKYLKHKVPFILIDNDDRMHDDNISDWKNKYKRYCNAYKFEPSDEIKNMELSPYRWMEDIGNYNPDIVFMAQKYKINTNEIYLPFGINKSYINYIKNNDINNDIKKRYIDIAHFPGPGHYRSIVDNILINCKKEQNMYNIFVDKVYGDMNIADSIKDYCINDNNIHSWHRWRVCKDYFDKLNDCKIVIYPSVDKPNAPGWDSKRPWEIISQGALILFQIQPEFDNSSYPIQEICDISEFKYNDYQDMLNKCELLLKNNDLFERKRKECYQNAIKYMTSEPITRYFLWNIQKYTLY